MNTYPNDFHVRLRQKAHATEQELAQYVDLKDGIVGIQQDGSVYPLLPTTYDRLSETEHQDANQNPLLWTDYSEADLSQLPSLVDHRPQHNPIRDQGIRPTCVAFSSLAAIEAVHHRMSGQFVVLSPHYAWWLFMQKEGRSQCDASGLRTTKAAEYLAEAGICLEDFSPYADEFDCNSIPSDEAQQQASYRVKTYRVIDKGGPNGPSIINPSYLEYILAAGFDVVIGVDVAWGEPDANYIFDIRLDAYNDPLRSRGGHAMLIVGYNRQNNIKYFIVRNSWGTSVGHHGYYYLSYDYVQWYGRYGFVVTELTDNKVV